MKFEKFYTSDKEGKSNCIIRTFCKLFNKEYSEVVNELLEIARQLNYESYAEIEVFEKYLNNHEYSVLQTNSEIQIKNLQLPLGKYAVFCYDKKDFYHMLSIEDNIIYDKDDTCLELYVITIYKENNKIKTY